MKTALSYLVVILFLGTPFALMVGPVWIPEFKKRHYASKLAVMTEAEWQEVYREAKGVRSIMTMKDGGSYEGVVNSQQLGSKLRKLGFKGGSMDSKKLYLGIGGGHGGTHASVHIQFRPDVREPAGIMLWHSSGVRRVYEVHESPKLTEVKDD